MIDNKKIEDAAKSLRKDFNDDVTQGFLVEFGFEKGAKWAINEFLKDLWHPVSEEPDLKQGEICISCLAKFKDGGIELCVYFRGEGWKCEYMSSKDFKRNLKEWLYIDDLLPKKGGKQC